MTPLLHILSCMLLLDAGQEAPTGTERNLPNWPKKSILFWGTLWGGGWEEDVTSDIDHQQLPKAPARTVEALNSSHSNRLGQPQCRTEHFRRSFMPIAVRLLNNCCCIVYVASHHCITATPCGTLFLHVILPDLISCDFFSLFIYSFIYLWMLFLLCLL